MSAIEFENIFKSYNGTRVLTDVSLSLPECQTTAIVGESGSGKSTLLQLVNGLIEPDSGTLRIEGKKLNYRSLYSLRKTMGYAVQGAGLFPHLTIRKNISLLAQLSAWEPRLIDERCDEFKSTVPAVLPLVPDETAWNVAGGPYACLSVSTG